MTTAEDLVLEVAKLLNDAEDGFEYLRWTSDDLLEYANDGAVQIAMLRPDVVSQTETIPLQPGARQELPEGSTRFFRVEGTVDRYGRIVGQPSKTDGTAARVANTWFTPIACPVSGDYVALSFSFDDTNPTVFYVEPPVPVGQSVKVAVSLARVPDEFGADDPVPIDRRFHNAVIEWMLYRAFSKDQESATNSTHAASHLKHFYDMLGMSQRADDRYYRKAAGELGNAKPD
ncbi:hypothetical protein SAMN05444172_2579 [Burkholderia sp. GAS332]|nr:hypothetical protein SAMN05444172_2579 [Burkholderia sp. GAS332]